jgi:hypothetical protein
MSDDNTYRGFEVESHQSQDGPLTVHVLRAQSGPISLKMKAKGNHDLPKGWTLRGVLERQIDKLVDPKVLRGVEHLN